MIERCEDNHNMELTDLEEEEEGKKEWEKRHHDQLWKIRVNLDNYTYEDKIFKYILFPRIYYSVVEETSTNPERYFTEQPKTNERFLMSENIFPDTDTRILYEITENSDIESDEITENSDIESDSSSEGEYDAWGTKYDDAYKAAKALGFSDDENEEPQKELTPEKKEYIDGLKERLKFLKEKKKIKQDKIEDKGVDFLDVLFMYANSDLHRLSVKLREKFIKEIDGKTYTKKEIRILARDYAKRLREELLETN